MSHVRARFAGARTSFWRSAMLAITRLAAAAVVASVPIFSAWAQQQTIRVRGTIERVDGPVLVVNAGEAGEMKVNLTDQAGVFGVVKASVADIKPGAFLSIGAAPQADGSQRAIQITIFAESQRGTGEGHRAWDRPNTTMTNATVETAVASVDGRVMLVKYRGGEQRVIIPPEAAIRAYVVSDRSELKPGANVAIFNAVKKPDGTIEAARVNVGRDGIVP
jgi:hypothetical protein